MKPDSAVPDPETPLAEPVPGADNYQLGREIARGGMGSVMEARDDKLGRSVAVKIMLQDADADPVMRQRFLREAEVLARLAHPNIVPIYDMVWEDGLPLFYVMKLVKGRTLQTILDDLRRADPGTLREYTLGRLLLIFRKICDAMAFAHNKRVIHRDLKPENVMVGEFGEVLVMDWGLAKKMDESSGPEPILPPATEAGSFGMTMQGSVVGTPHYMSPEQAMGRNDELDERSDIYALGGILYAILTLYPPVEGTTMEDVLGKVTSSRITAPGQRAKRRGVSGAAGSHHLSKADATPPWPVPAALSAVVMKALNHDKAARYDEVAALAAEIEAYQNGFATRAQQAGAGRLLQLFILRHKAATALLAAFVLFGVGFVLKLIASERKAVANEQIAIAEKEAARRALAEARLAVAEAGLSAGNGVAMQNALNEVPSDLRSPLWHYLMGESDTSIAQVPAGPGGIREAVGDPSRAGVFAFSGTTGGITLFVAATGQILLDLKPGFTTPGDAASLSLAFSADGRWLAAARRDGGGMVIHDARSGHLEKEWPTPPARHLEFGAGAQILLSGDQSIEMWDTLSGTRLWQHGSPGLRGILTPDRQQVLTCGDEGQLQLLSARDGSVIRSPGPPRPSRRGELLVHPAGKTAFINHDKGLVECVDLQDGSTRFEVRTTPRDKPVCLGISPGQEDGDSLLITAHRATYDRQVIQVWNASTGKSERPLRGGRGGVEAVRVHPLSSELLIVGPTARVWNLASPPFVARTTSGAASGMAFWGSDDLLFCGGFVKNNEGWGWQDLRNQTLPPVWSPPHPGHHRAGVSGDGKVAAVFQPGSGHPILLLRQPSAGSGKPVECFRRIPPPFDVRRVYLNRAGTLLAVSDYEVGLDAVPGTRIAVFDTSTGRSLNPPDLTNVVAVRALGWLHGESSLVGLVSTGRPRGNDGSVDSIFLWDASSGRIIRTAPYEAPMDILAVAPDGRHFAEAGSTGNEHSLRIRDAETLAVQQEIRIHNGRVSAIAWHPSRPLLATADSQSSIRLWDRTTARLVREWRSYEVPLHLSFSPTGTLLLSENNESGVGRIWKVDDLGNLQAAPIMGEPGMPAAGP